MSFAEAVKLNMEEYTNVVISAAEFIKDRLYFVTLETTEQPKSTSCTHYFSIEDHLQYESFISDFGPLNLAMLYHYCVKVNKKLNSNYLKNKKIVHITSDDTKKRVNAACLIASYAIIYLDMTPPQAYTILNFNNRVKFINFRDASYGAPYTISLLDCLCGLHKAFHLGFFDFSSFNHHQYEYYERVENGDLNWIIPGKMLGFCGPHNRSKNIKGYPLHSPEFYFKYFRKNNVTAIVRLNKKMYDASKFSNNGFQHYDLYFLDGSVPTDKILSDFISICEKTDGAVAVHCKAGLGRTGTLIACYLMKHYGFTAREAIAWIRICRPGSVIGHQQEWLEGKQAAMWKEGEAYRKKKGLSGPVKHTVGIYPKGSDNSIEEMETKVQQNDNVSGILKKVDTMKLNDKEDNSYEEEDGCMTQGDRLNQIKAQRRQCKPLATSSNNERRVFRSRVAVNTLETTSVIRGGKLLAAGVKTSTSTSRVLAKRNGTSEVQQNISPRRCSLRKAGAQALGTSCEKTKTGLKRNENRWLPEEPKKDEEKKETKTLKRGKRTLNTDKEKCSPRSVKVLRRSQAHTLEDTKPVVKLPVVKVSKSI